MAHHVPGRMRLKVLGVLAEEDFFATVKKVIANLEGVHSVRVNASSSSIVIDYSPADTVFHFRLQDDPNVSAWLHLQGDDALLAGVDEAVATGTHEHYLAQHSRLAEDLVAGAEQLDLKLRSVSDGYVDLKLLLPLVFASALSLHPLRSVSVQEHRLERLTSPTPLDNRISFGCVNVMPAFFDKVVQPVFTHTTGTVYVLPETRSWPSVFLSPSVRFEPVH